MPGSQLVRKEREEGILMLSCKDVTQLISESMDHSLPIGKRIGMRLHLLMCKFCSRYERQLLLIREAAKYLVAAEDKPGEPPGEALSEETKDRIRKSLRNP
ncbi:MAG: anti-sigma factor family protein [Desulfobacteria bacterium]